jgi:opacity protein-like surface antigen
MYISLSASSYVLGRNIQPEVTAQMYSLEGAYRVWSGPVSVDLLAGGRYPYLKVKLQGPLRSPSRTTRNWVPIAGVRVLAPIDEQWGVLGYVDGGKRGGRNDWQAVLGVNYKYSDEVTAEFGYRYLRFNGHEDDASFAIKFHGPYAGAHVSF